MDRGYHWSCDLNQAGIRTDMDFQGKSLKALMKRANKLGSAYVLIAGENELAKNAVILRNMTTKEQVSLELETLVPELIRICKNPNR
jgi:histidyl-tRNA synthetase